MLEPEEKRISHVGLIARSSQGHAAKGMQILGNEDFWIKIQADTFRNWVNEHLRPLGLSVNDLSTDFSDGTKLIALVEALQKRTLKKIHKPINQHQMLENVSKSLEAIRSDGVKLVNIANEDLTATTTSTSGNLKLILGLIWSLIVRYQIGRSKFPPKKLMLAWLRACLPENNINNFTSDWNSGKNLAALVEYCRPGLFPHWRNLNPHDGESNCQIAMDLAKRELGVPVVLDPEYLASPHLDELSGMTYVSYFMRENGPGYKATLNWVRNQLPERHIGNFTTDWNDGQLLCELVRSLGGPVPMDSLSSEQENWESNLNLGIKGAEKLGVSPLLRAKDLADPSVDHLGVMAYTASFQWLPKRKPPGERISVHWESDSFRKGIPISFLIKLQDEEVTDFKEITVEVKGPSGKVDCRINMLPGGGRGTFTATDIGIHEVVVKYQGEPVTGSPLKCRILPVLNKVAHPGLEPCTVNSVVEVLVNPQDASPAGAKKELLEVIAISPSGKEKPCEVEQVFGGFSATFKPDEAGLWQVQVMYKGNPIESSPFPCFAYNPNGIKLDCMEGALPGLPWTFICDSRNTGGIGEVDLDVTKEGRSIPFRSEYIIDGMKRIHLPVLDAGKHRIHVYFNGTEIRGSPFSLRVGTGRTRKKEGSGGRSRRMKSSRDYDEFYSGNKNHDSYYNSNNSNEYNTSFMNSSSNTNKTLYDSKLSEINNRLQSSSINYNSLNNSPTPTPAAAATPSPTITTAPVNKSPFQEDDTVDATHPRFRFGGHKSQMNKETVAENTTSSSSSQLHQATATTTKVESSSQQQQQQQHQKQQQQQKILSTREKFLNAQIQKGKSLNLNEMSFLKPSSSGTATTATEEENITEKSAKSSSYNANFAATNTTATSSNSKDFYESKSSTNFLQSRNNNSNNNSSNSNWGDLVVDGDGLGIVQINSQVSITIASEYGQTSLEDVIVEIRGPSGRVPARIIDVGSSICAKYMPSEVGEFLIDIKIGKKSIEGCPFRAAVFNPKAIKVTRVPKGYVGRPVEIEIDGHGAGPGHLAILVDGGRVTSQVKALGDHRFRAVFLPFDSGIHTVDMTFNSIPVKGSPWRVDVMEADGMMDQPSFQQQQHNVGDGEFLMIKGEPIRHIPYGKVASFEISAPGFNRESIDVTVLSPSKNPLSYRLLEESNGQFTLEFTPNEVGSHLVEVFIAGKRLSVVAKVYNASLIKVVDITPGAAVGQISQFKVDASRSGEGQLEISINDGELPNQVRVLGGGCCLVTFTPEQAKPHSIQILFNSETIPGCPIIIQVADSRQVAVHGLTNLELIPIHQVSRFHISVDGNSSAELAVSVKGPNSIDLPVKVSGSVRSGFTAEFTPNTVGPHTIIVNHNGSLANGTPFIAKSYDSKRVFVSPLPRGAVGRNIQFFVDASQSGEGNLEITITAGAKGKNVPTNVHPQGGARFAVSFIPLEPIDHTIIVTFNKEPVPGSPFVASVSSDPSQISVTGNLSATSVGKTAQFTLNNVQSSLDDVEVAVEGPSNVIVPAQVLEKSKNTYGVEFTPRTPGEHKIKVSVKGLEVPGSPFSCKVYDITAIKVTNTDSGVVGKPVTFLVDTSRSGPGNLEVTVNQGQVPTSAQAQGSHTYAISFTPKEAKDHLIELRFNGEDIPGSPFICPIVDPTKVNITGEGLEKVPVGKKATFQIEPEGNLGQPEVTITGPLKKSISPVISPTNDNKFIVEYTPVDVGDHQISVLIGGLNKSFLAKSYDYSKVKVTDITPGVKGKPVYFSIDAGSSGAGNLEIIVSVNGKNVPNYVQAEGNAKFRVNFRPQEASNHLLSIRFNGFLVNGSPFICPIFDASLVQVTGAALKIASVSQPAIITIDPMGADVNNCNVLVLSPSGTHLPINLIGTLPEKIQASFNPLEVGPHSVSISLNGEPVNGSPFNCNVYDVRKVRISGLDDGRIGEPMTFTVDASTAGEGTLELVVTTGKQSLRAEVSARSRGLYDVTFVPNEPTLHFVNITFNDVEVPGSPFECAIEEESSNSYAKINGHHLNGHSEFESISDSSTLSQLGMGIMTDGLDTLLAGSTAYIDFERKSVGSRSGTPDISVMGPDQSSIQVRKRMLTSGLTRAEFTPERVGVYNVTINDPSGAQIISEPIKTKVFDPLLVRIKDRAESAILGQDYTFKVDFAKSGIDPEVEGSFEVKVRAGLGEVYCSKRNLGNGVFSCSFKPLIPLNHRVFVIVGKDGHSAKNSPFELTITDNGNYSKDTIALGSGLYMAKAGKTSGFTILTKGSSGRDYDFVVSGPKGVAVPVRCYQQRDGNLRAEFTPSVVGSHEIAIFSRSKQIKNSPFLSQVYDSQRVTIGNLPTNLTVGQSLSLPIDTSNAGNALLEAEITGPEGVPKPIFPLEQKDDGNIIKFTPKRPGKYKLVINYGGEPIIGCPYTLTAEELGAAKAEGAGLNVAHVGKKAIFQIIGPGLPGSPSVLVEGPDSVAKCELKKIDPGHYQAAYNPTEVGVFDIRVTWAGVEVPGSVFHPRTVDCKKLRIIGGWEAHCTTPSNENGNLAEIPDNQKIINLAVGEERKITFNTLDAGPGTLEAKVEIMGQNSEVIKSDDFVRVENSVAGRTKLILTPRKIGDYKLILKWGKFEMEDSPKKISVLALPPDRDIEGPVLLSGPGLQTARTGEEAYFTIDASKAGFGSASVSLHNAEVDVPVTVQPLGGAIYKAIYIPRLSGNYELNVTWGGKLIVGCPRNVNVGAIGDASKVICTGDGLRIGQVGKDIRSFIDTRSAGAGELTAQCTGTKKTAYCELYDHGDGTFTLNIRPQEPGKHSLSIKYNGDNVNGSPFNLKVIGLPDPSKIKVFGPGIEHGVLATFQSRFICDTRGGGAGQLTVRVRGPKGAFRVEMQRESQKDRTILCKYDPTEPGDYRIETRWAGEHVPGSPFHVIIVDTLEEMQNLLQIKGGSPGPGVQSDYYGSTGQIYSGQMSWRGSQAQL